MGKKLILQEPVDNDLFTGDVVKIEEKNLDLRNEISMKLQMAFSVSLVSQVADVNEFWSSQCII